MKQKVIIKTEFKRSKDDETDGFITGFQIHMLRALTKRGLITERQCEKGITFLKEMQH